MKVSAQSAASDSDDILSAASNCEADQVAIPENSTAKLLCDEPSATQQETGPRILGAGRKHLFGQGESMGTLPTDKEWDAMDKEIAREMTEGPLIPGETLDETLAWLIPAMEKAKAEGFPNSLRRRGTAPPAPDESTE